MNDNLFVKMNLNLKTYVHILTELLTHCESKNDSYL